MCRLRTCPLLLLLGLNLAFSVTSTHAQTLPPTTATDQLGTVSSGSYHGGDIDSVSVTNGTLSLNLPFLSYPQRGNLHLSFNLMYNNLPQHYAQVCIAPDPCQFDWNAATPQSPLGSWSGSVVAQWAQAVGMVGTSVPYSWKTGTITYTEFYGNWSLFFADGSAHVMGNQGTASWSAWENGGIQRFQIASGPFGTLDATGWHALGAETIASTQTNGSPTAIISPDGTRYGSTTIEDANGNLIGVSQTALTDSLGRQISFPPTSASASNTDTSGCVGPLPISKAVLWTPPSYNSGAAPYKFCYASVTPNMGSSTTIGTDTINCCISPFTALQSIVLPNGQAWEFEYNDPDSTQTNNGQPVTYGTLSKITLPTGGTITYTYQSVAESSTHCQNGGRWIASRTVTDQSGAHTWTYGYNLHSSPSFTVVSDPLGNDTVHTFSLGSLLQCSLVETQTQYYQGSYTSGTLLKTVNTNYSSSSSANSKYGYVNLVPTQVTTTWPNGQVMETTKSYDSGFQYTDYLGASGNTGIYGKVLTQNDYDYGSGGAGPLLRTTNTAFMALSGPNASSYLANNLLSLPYTVQTLNGSGAQVAFTQFNYDETSRASSGLSSSQQFDSSPPTGSFRGNNTSTYRWLNTGTLTCPNGQSGGSSSNLISKATYFDDGMLNTSADPCSNTTTFAYSQTYWAALLTTVTNALNQSTSHAYDFNTALSTSTTDPNNLTTSSAHDSMWRLTSVTHPDTEQETIARQEASFPVTSSLTKQINANQSESTTNVFDGLGRIKQTQLNSDPQGVVYTDTTFDALGRVATVSNPYRTGNDPTTTTGITTYGYDALGRKTSETYPDSSVLTTAYCGPSTLVADPAGKWRRSRVDGLGRLVEVDEPNAPGASVNSNGCPGTGEPIWVTSYTYDALGNLISVLQNGSHQRSFTYDSLSRLLTSTNPEVGTITYAYNPDGPVLTKTDARGIVTCYGTWSGSACNAATGYDALYRPKTISYSNGDPTVSMNYDASNCLGLSSCQNIGQRTSMTDDAGSEAWSYQVDPSNYRSVHVDQRTTNGITKTSTYYLDLAGNVTQAVYPTGRVVDYMFDNADRPITAVSGSGGIVYATGSVTVGGNEQSVTTSNAAPGTGSVTLSGTLQSKQVLSQAATSGTGSVAFSGSLQSTQVQTQAATAASGWVQVVGSEQLYYRCPPNRCPTYDTGSVKIILTSNGTTVASASASFGQGSNATYLASVLASGLNGSVVTATASGSTVNITTTSTGSTTNYSITLQWTSTGYNQGYLGQPSFTLTPSGSTLTGGQNAVYTTVYDSGTCTITVNSHGDSASWSGSGTTTSSIASALASAISGDGGAFVNASASGTTVNLTAKATGAATNYSLASSCSYDSTHFSSPSFSTSNSGSALTGGKDAVYNTIYDSGTSTITVNGHSNTASWSGSGTTTSSIASALASNINADSGASVTASASAATVNLTAKTAGSGTNYSLSSSSTYDTSNFSSPSFSSSNSGSTLTGGTNAQVVYDTGSVSVTVNGFTASTTYGQSSSPASIASALATGLNGASSPITASASGGVVTLTAKTAGSAGNYPLSTSVSYDTTHFSSASFTASLSGSTLTGGSSTVTGVQSPPSGCQANAVCYTPQGTFYALSIGQSSSFTGLNLTHIYNNRLQPQEFKAFSSGGNAIDITYSFVDPASGHNASHVYGITNNVDGTRSQTFSYDQLNRIIAAQTTSTYSSSSAHCWGETYALDAWGNLNSIAATSNSAYTGCSQESGFSTTADSNNHLPSWAYDASGNATSDSVVTNYQWNAESQLKSAAGVTYTYDGDGRRVSKVGSKLYWYGSGGDILAETDSSGNTTAEYIFFGGKRIAMIPAGSNPIYYVEDMLGTSRVVTTNTGVVCYDADFYPYGGERSYTNTCPQNYKFEGKERDSETGNDDFGARYYSNRFGRWLSADWSAVPAPIPYAHLTNPQTLNLYSMVADDPESFADLDGHNAMGLPSGSPMTFDKTPSALQNLEDELEAEHRAQVDAANAAEAAAAQAPQTPAKDQNAQSAQETNSAVQFVKDEAKGMAKEAYNTLAGLDNWFYSGVNALLGTNFHVEEAKPATPGENNAMLGTSVALLLMPGGGETKALSKGEKISQLTADAEKLYPKLAGKLQDHHIIPKYLGGAKDGATARIPAAYHQLITNEFRKLAPYGQSIQRSAAQVGRIVQQVYSKFPLP